MDPTTFKLMMAAGGGTAPPSESYWISAYINGQPYQIQGIKVDSSGNVYIVGSASGSFSITLFIAKFNDTGVLQWQRILDGTATSEYSAGLALDSSNNVYIVGYNFTSLIVAKYDTDGVIQWERKVGTSNNTYGLGIAVDSSNNVYVTGYTNSQGAGGQDAIIIKYNSSGTLQWQRTLGNSYNGYATDIDVDSSGNVYIVGDLSFGGQPAIMIAKYNTSGTIQWQEYLSFGGFLNSPGRGITVDSSNNVYITGYNTGGTCYLAKFDTNGNVQWQRAVDSLIGYRVTVDSSSNVYIIGSTFAGKCFIAKYNTSGTIQWQRDLTNANNGSSGLCIDVSNTGIVYIGTAITFGSIMAENDYSAGLFAKFPTDGSLTGTYTWTGTGIDNTDVTYAVSTYVTSTPTLTVTASSLTSSTSTLPDNIGYDTDSAGTYTETKITL
jgi:hypothetical protein